MDRRTFLGVGTLAASSALIGLDLLQLNPLASSPAQAWPRGCIDRLPHSAMKRMAWTLDDGYSQKSLQAYINLLENHPNLKMTMFVLPSARSWKNLAKPIRALASAGQLQLGNHTFNHIDLTKASDKKVRHEFASTDSFIKDVFEVDPGPYWRPPYGYIDERVISLAAELGLTKPILWLGSTGSAAHASSAGVWRMCQKWMLDGHIVIDHANNMSTPANFSKILGLLTARGLKTVTLAEAFD